MSGDTKEIFDSDFVEQPYWWEAVAPGDESSQDLPASADVVVIGSGYAGLNAALELARSGVNVAVLEKDEIGAGASTRNGGAVSGGTNLGKGLSGSAMVKAGAESHVERMFSEAADSLSLVEDLIERENIECDYARCGRFVGAFVPEHYRKQTQVIDRMNKLCSSDARMVPREQQHEEISSTFYYGGMVVERAGKLQPALYHRGLLEAALKAGVRLCSQTEMKVVSGRPGALRVETNKGQVTAEKVVMATNGYTGGAIPDLQRRVVPVASHIIATEELPKDLAESLIPKGRTINDTPRVLCYYRMSPDGRRMIFGGRARFGAVGPERSAPALYQAMVARFPQLKGYRVTHAWTGNVAFAFDMLPHMGVRNGIHYCLGCNGSGIAIMTYLGTKIAHRIIRGDSEPQSVFEENPFPTRPMYRGNPWFLPMVGGYYRLRDRIDRLTAMRSPTG